MLHATYCILFTDTQRVQGYWGTSTVQYAVQFQFELNWSGNIYITPLTLKHR